MNRESGQSLPPEVALGLNEELRRFPDFKPEATFVFPLSSGRHHVIEAISNNDLVGKDFILGLMASDDFVEQDAALYFLCQVKNIKDEFGQDVDRVVDFIQENPGNDSNEDVSKIRYKLMFESNTQEALERSASRIDAISQSFRSSQEDFTYDDARKEETGIAYSLRFGGPDAIPELENILLKSVTLESRAVAVHSLAAINGGKEVLLKLLNDGKLHDFFGDSPAESEAIKVLFGNSKVGNKVGLDELQGYRKLITSRKPLLASGNLEFLDHRFLALDQIAMSLEQEFGDKFSGIIIMGSTTRGYAQETSDLDAVVLGSDPQIADKFKNMADQHQIKVCTYCFMQIDDKNDNNLEQTEKLFTGIYVGNREKLLRFQQQILSKIDQEYWDGMRGLILKVNTDLTKLAVWLSVKDEEKDKIKTLIELNTVPPPLELARVAIENRKVRY